MKKYIYLSAVALGSMMMSSCDMDAPTQSSVDAQTVSSIYELAEQAVMGINLSFCETNSYRGRFLPYYGVNTDVEWINSNGDEAKWPDESKYDLAMYNATATNAQMNTENNAYAKFYEGIERANMVIKSMRENADLEDEKMQQLLGELLTMRALIYMDLIKGWGDVPYRFEPISSETLYLGRTDRDVIYKKLLDDLYEAENLCAWPNDLSITKTTERVNKAFVKGLRARVALYAGGYSQRADGKVRLSNNPELAPEKMDSIAYHECMDVINSKKCTLGSFKENFVNLCKDKTVAGGESLYELPFSETRGRVLYTFGIKHQEKDQYTQQAQGGATGPVPTLFYDYDVDDVRRDITCAPYRWSKEKTSVQELWAAQSWCFGKLRYEWMDRLITNTNDDGVNWQFMRLADVYLMAAEAANELYGPTEGWKHMEPIVRRAFPTNSEKVKDLQKKYTASKEAFFEGIVEQRAFEFAGEMLRKADLIRWNLLKTKLDETKVKLNQLRNREGAYADLPENIYYTLVSYKENGDTDINETRAGSTAQFLKIYGLNHGDTDEEGEKLVNDGYQKVQWLGESKIKDGYINGLYLAGNDPNQHQYWPIWATFISSSNNMLNNDWLIVK